MTNPLLEKKAFIPFSQINVSQIEVAIDLIISDNLAKLETLLKQETLTWDNLIVPLQEQDARLSEAWSPVSHLNSVRNADDWRVAYNNCLPKLSAYGSELGQHQGLYEAYKTLSESADFSSYNAEQKRTIEKALRDFKLSGIALPKDKQDRYKEIQSELSSLSSKYGENVLDSENDWSKHVANEADLSGVPEVSLGILKQNAEKKELEGYLLNLEIPCFQAIVTYCDNGALREELYRAFTTRASEIGPTEGKFDNTPNMSSIVRLRQELAELLDFNNYAELSLATKMAGNTDVVLDFLNDLVEKSYAIGQKEYAELLAFVKDEYGVEELNAWDAAYYIEKMKLARYSISQEELRPYFPESIVFSGMFDVAERIFGVTFEEQFDFDTYHDDVRLFKVVQNGEAISYFYTDIFARAKKRGGAWVDQYRGRAVCGDGSVDLPICYLVCNFTPAVGDKEALLTHDEVVTMFHEFGHALHGVLSKATSPDVGSFTVAWDFVELPSQFMENYCWEEEALAFLSSHHETKEPLPKDLLDKMLKAKNFRSASIMLRQLEFALFDFTMHMDKTSSEDGRIAEILADVRSRTAVMPTPDFNRFQNAFTHIFSGGYCAGYYSYKWAEVLSADAFSKFEEDGIFNQETGLSFLENILEKGSSEKESEIFKAFRGRDPKVDALLQHNGIV